jgi:hypothetical protein
VDAEEKKETKFLKIKIVDVVEKKMMKYLKIKIAVVVEKNNKYNHNQYKDKSLNLNTILFINILNKPQHVLVHKNKMNMTEFSKLLKI